MSKNRSEHNEASLTKAEDIVFGEAELNRIIDAILAKQAIPAWTAKQAALAVARIARAFQMPEQNIQAFYKAIQLHTVCGNASGTLGWLKSPKGGERIGTSAKQAGEEQA